MLNYDSCEYDGGRFSIKICIHVFFSIFIIKKIVINVYRVKYKLYKIQVPKTHVFWEWWEYISRKHPITLRAYSDWRVNSGKNIGFAFLWIWVLQQHSDQRNPLQENQRKFEGKFPRPSIPQENKQSTPTSFYFSCAWERGNQQTNLHKLHSSDT